VDGEPLRLRHVNGDEFHMAVHEVRDEGPVTREAVKPGDEKYRPAPAAFF